MHMEKSTTLGSFTAILSRNINMVHCQQLENFGFFKASEIPHRFDIINNKAVSCKFDDKTKQLVMELLMYFKLNWLEKWPIKLWCQFNQKLRTDNLSESYHSALVKRLCCKKPTLNKLLITLMKHKDSELLKINQMDKGKNHFINRPTLYTI
ncbi:hypothetical protein EIN_521410 [Entamoeba invadens IP1]|uniref:Uncharacterized protein n=1 Tax=Entamoeba invadens IP1 TaxID=370355 RepID=A0A0A1U9W7_ENTIV|nr:hypothetical protein EIN_521410 [Entamoeba invadens IP1]ELP91734.1 hypothetical protein EIN_521410 [Entamoeba invadens IP1]|eukprot:XP_004258505.1 hypothetical protein EIN_521410 [Entamoeba invadens IP1]